MSDGQSSEKEQLASERVTIAEAFAAVGSADHETGGADLGDVMEALSEPHPAVAGDFVELLQRSLDTSHGGELGTQTGSEHPDWHDSLRRAKKNSLEEGYE